MKLVVMSDTHGFHRAMPVLPYGDVLIHCGDFTNIGERSQVEDFIQWLIEKPHPHKIFIAGNHDRSFDPKFNVVYDYLGIEHLYSSSKKEKPRWLIDILSDLKDTNISYLENNGVTIDGVKFWGSPITPDFYPRHWAFNEPRGKIISKYWEQIPTDTDVLITHGPPEFKLDWVKSGQHVGCADLRYTIENIKPKYHLFGHIHESYGIEQMVDTTFINASMLNEKYIMVNEPLVIKI